LFTNFKKIIDVYDVNKFFEYLKKFKGFFKHVK